VSYQLSAKSDYSGWHQRGLIRFKWRWHCASRNPGRGRPGLHKLHKQIHGGADASSVPRREATPERYLTLKFSKM